MSVLGLCQTVTVLLTLSSLSLYFFLRLYHARKIVSSLQKQGLPVAPNHNFLFGHLLYLKSMIDKLPRNAHYQSAFGDIAREHFSKEGVFYVDLWPVTGLFLIVVSPNVATQIHANAKISMERPSLLPRFFKPICGGPSMFDLRESKWRPWRAVFSRGFGADHILSLVPGMVDETTTYCQTLETLALKNELFYLDPTTLRFTLDVIGKTILNAPLGAQRGYNTLADCMLSQIQWHQANAETNPFENLNFARSVMHWWNGRQMDKYIGNELDKRYEEYKADPEGKRTKAVIDLVLQAYLSENSTKLERLDPEFRAFAISQIRLFLFVGHDSTSSTICYILHLLSTNPEVLSKIRAEHETLLGPDPSAVPSLLKEQPHLTNDLPYTTAVIKESLRLFSPGGCSRAGKPGVSLLDDNNNTCPTEHAAAVFTVHTELHRAPVYWTQPDDFLPERWLVPPGHELYPLKGSYRAFEIGPRNCIAQGFVMTELRVVLACVVRRFEVRPAYDEWDSLYPRKGLMSYRGERAYQIEGGAAHPVDRYPCRVFVRGSEGGEREGGRGMKEAKKGE